MCQLISGDVLLDSIGKDGPCGTPESAHIHLGCNKGCHNLQYKSVFLIHLSLEHFGWAHKIVFAMLKTFWKPHKSKGLNFLHRNCTQFFFSTPKNIFSEIDRKKKWQKKVEFFEKKSKIWKNQQFSMKIIWFFIENVWHFSFFDFFSKCLLFVFTFFFDRSQKKYFSELKNKIEYSFDVKNWDLSIYDVFSAFWAL